MAPPDPARTTLEGHPRQTAPQSAAVFSAAANSSAFRSAVSYSAASEVRAAPPDRYQDLGPIARGGMGEIRRILDRDLNRTLVMKIIHHDLLHRTDIIARFIDEAQATAQLQHPGVVPVHELGRLADGRLYFTMKEIQGRTLLEVIREVHGSSRERWVTTSTGWTFRWLIDALHKACDAVAYAHERGVLHRDLKPSNIMVGDHGEVLVVDWGLVKILGQSAGSETSHGVVTERSRMSGAQTLVGSVTGTPAYMPPEQARGETDRLDSRCDVYALGAILYEVLTGRPPYYGVASVVQAVIEGPPPPPDRLRESSPWEERARPPLPDELVETCVRAMARAPEARFADAGELAAEVALWLDGARRRERALAVLTQARSTGPQAEQFRQRASLLRLEAARRLTLLGPNALEPDKAAAWELEREAGELDGRAELAEVESQRHLHAALNIDPTLPEAHRALIDQHKGALAAAEQRRDTRAVLRSGALLRQHLEALPSGDDTRESGLSYLKGDGSLTLVTDPPGAHVELSRYETHHRRMVLGEWRPLGRTPLRDVVLPMGSYLCRITAPGRVPIRYPVRIRRQKPWTSRGPEGETPIWLPSSGALEADECYVPAGWYRSGGDLQAAWSLPARRLWLDGFVIRRFSFTITELMRCGVLAPIGADPRDPARNIDLPTATQVAGRMAATTGLPWRLPTEYEWEKAARGVDGRAFPWGDHFDRSWCVMRDSHSRLGRRGPATVDHAPLDESPYGVRGLAGNVQEWTSSAWDEWAPEDVRSGLADWAETPRDAPRQPPEPLPVKAPGKRVLRGGSFRKGALFARVTNRRGCAPGVRAEDLGFRLVRSLRSEP